MGSFLNDPGTQITGDGYLDNSEKPAFLRETNEAADQDTVKQRKFEI